jgi:hypothetical protein
VWATSAWLGLRLRFSALNWLFLQILFSLLNFLFWDNNKIHVQLQEMMQKDLFTFYLIYTNGNILQTILWYHKLDIETDTCTIIFFKSKEYFIFNDKWV